MFEDQAESKVDSLRSFGYFAYWYIDESTLMPAVAYRKI
jgi:hypothetical protein